MNLTLSKRGDYVLRSALCLAKAYPADQSKKIREVVAEMAVPQTFASQILADLVKADLAVSKAGRDGGYKLTRSPSSISVLEVVEAGEGSLIAQRCALGDGPCRWESVCPMHDIWGAAAAAFRQSLKLATLADLVTRDQALEAGTYSTPPDSHRGRGAPVPVLDDMHVEVSLEVVRELFKSSRPSFLLAATQAHRQAVQEMIDKVADLSGTAISRVDLNAAAPAIKLSLGEMNQEGQDIWLSASWEGEGNGLATSLDAKIKFSALDPNRTVISLDGTWNSRLLNADGYPYQSDIEGTAKASIRCFLASIARQAEERAYVASYW